MGKAEQGNGSVPWHALSVEEVFESLSSDPGGLSDEEIGKKLEEYGRNELKGEEGESLFSHILKQFKSPLIYLLLIAALVSLAAGKHLDTLIIGVVVLFNASLGVIQEYRAEQALAALKSLATPHAKVLREGKVHDIEAALVVPGDVLVMERGARIAADARVISSSELKVDESALTGESEPVPKKTDTLDPGTAMADRKNMVFMSTLVTGGRARAVVVATGMETAMGGIAGEVRTAERERTPLQRRLGKLSMYIGLFAIFLAGAVFVLGLLRTYDVGEMLLYSVAVAVSAIPEGLPAVISVTLALGVRRMAERNAVIRRLPAVETLGSTTVVCSDKTGTITENQMTAVKIMAGGNLYEVTGEGYTPKGEIRPIEKGDPDTDECLQMLVRIGCLVNDAELLEEEGQWRIKGSPTEGALLVASAKKGLDCEKMQEEHPRVADFPFSSEQKYMASLHSYPEEERALLMVKGAPERVLEFCSHKVENGERIDIDDTQRERLEGINHDLAAEGLRVVAAAWKDFPRDKKDLSREEAENGLTLAGMWGLVDPPRAEAVRAIENAHEAGMRVIMLTGDHASTARAIGAKVGIAEKQEWVMTGHAIDSMNDEEFSSQVERTDVFARVSPSHKLRIMQALQEKGEIVAMTGDGVNDAPALKSAGIGVAMGRTGTEVAREAADMVLTDDNFATIIAAVEEGRVIFNNLRRVVFFLLTTNVGEVLTLIAALVLGLPLPVTAVMILWINLLTDGVSTIPLGLEPKHRDVLDRPPRSPDEGILDKVTLRRIILLAPVMAAGVTLVYWFHLEDGHEYARTMAFTTLAAFQWFQALNARSSTKSIFTIGLFSNRWLVLGLSAAVILQLGTVYLEFGQFLFGTVPLALSDWGLAILASSSILLVDETLKFFDVHGKQPGRN
ncbi:MAG: cation-translocating P-type ATPase [Desulfovibrionales bacterium]